LICISFEKEIKGLNNDLISKARTGECGEIQIHEMLKAVTVLNTTSAGQSYLLDHRGDEKFSELLEMINNIIGDMRNGMMNVPDIATKYMEKIPQVE
jgi:hypothetical protein